MPRYSVIFEREVIERALLWIDAEDKADAEKKALKMLTEDDWDREEFGVATVIVQAMKGKIK